MLKRYRFRSEAQIQLSAAFARLCVETLSIIALIFIAPYSAAFARLCVETLYPAGRGGKDFSAAFARLCVETLYPVGKGGKDFQPPSRGCVLKLLLVSPYKNTN